jgi:UDP-N-acetylmuramate-alanine ligase
MSRAIIVTARTRNRVEFSVAHHDDETGDVVVSITGAHLDARTFAAISLMLADDVDTVDITGRAVKHETIAHRVENPPDPE